MMRLNFGLDTPQSLQLRSKGYITSNSSSGLRNSVNAPPKSRSSSLTASAASTAHGHQSGQQAPSPEAGYVFSPVRAIVQHPSSPFSIEFPSVYTATPSVLVERFHWGLPASHLIASTLSDRELEEHATDYEQQKLGLNSGSGNISGSDANKKIDASRAQEVKPPSTTSLQHLLLRNMTVQQRETVAKEVAATGLNAFLLMLFRHGYFHADLHPGNIIIDLGYDWPPPCTVTVRNSSETHSQCSECAHSSRPAATRGAHRHYDTATVTSATESDISSCLDALATVHVSDDAAAASAKQANQEQLHYVNTILHSNNTVTDFRSSNGNNDTAIDNVSVRPVATAIKASVSSVLSSLSQTVAAALCENSVYRQFYNSMACNAPSLTLKLGLPTPTSTSNNDDTPADTSGGLTSTTVDALVFEPALPFAPLTMFPSTVFQALHPNDSRLHEAFAADHPLAYQAWYLAHGLPLPPRQPRLILIDAGMTTPLLDSEMVNFRDLFYAVALGRGKEAAEMMVDRAPTRPNLPPRSPESRQQFVDTVSALIDKAASAGFKLSSLGVVETLQGLVTAARTHLVPLDPAFLSVIVAVTVTEGVGRSLDPNVDIVTPAITVVAKARIDELLAQQTCNLSRLKRLGGMAGYNTSTVEGALAETAADATVGVESPAAEKKTE